jgi:hypothetical protein
MRLKPLILVLLAGCLVLPATASAKLTVGISENNWQMFSDPNYQKLGVKTTRLVVSYNVMSAAQRGDDEIHRVQTYLAAAAASGVDVLVSFEHARGAAENCKDPSFRAANEQCRLPSNTEYRENIRAFLQAFPMVKTISPFNEVNHFTQPTARNVKAAAQFTKTAASVCKEIGRKCRIVEVDILDQADSASAKKPTYRATKRYIKAFRKAYGKKLSLCGLHTYSDVNRFRMTGTKSLMKALKCKKYWLTESGGLYNFGSFWTASMRKAAKCKNAAACQLKATKFMFKVLRKHRRKIDRAYVYTWYGTSVIGQPGPRFDAGLVFGRPGEPTKPRPAYHFVAKKI